jgi:hypothetical protein
MRNGAQLKRFLLLLSAAILLFACATVEPPSGGPLDKDAPRISAVFPAPRATMRPTKLDVRIQFNEWIMNPVPRSAVKISPPLSARIETEVDGDLLILSSKAELDSVTTYTISIGSVLEDLHKNPVAKPFQLVFSTGPLVDTLQVFGTILLPDSLRRTKKFPTVGLYPIGVEARNRRSYLVKLRDSSFVGPDTIPRLVQEPLLFLGQSDSLGRFRIDGVAPGNYRVAAFLDLNGNNRIDPASEIAGLAENDIRIDSSMHDSLFMTLANLDTASNRLTAYNILSKRIVSLEYTRPYRMDSSTLSSCTLFHLDSSIARKASLAWIAADTRRLTLAFDSVSQDSSFLLGCSPKQLMKVRWITGKDSLVQRMSQFELDGPAVATDSLPRMIISYRMPLRADSLLQNLRFVSGKDTLPVQGGQLDPVRVWVQPKKPLAMGTSHKLIEQVRDTTKVRGDTSKTPKYSTRTLGSFETSNPLKLTTLQGRLRGATIHSRVRIKSAISSYVWSTLCTSNGEFRMERLPEGAYVMDVFHDFDNDSIPSAGSLSPYKPADFWRPIRDTLRIGSDTPQNRLDSLFSKIQFPLRNPR